MFINDILVISLSIMGLNRTNESEWEKFVKEEYSDAAMLDKYDIVILNISFEWLWESSGPCKPFQVSKNKLEES